MDSFILTEIKPFIDWLSTLDTEVVALVCILISVFGVIFTTFGVKNYKVFSSVKKVPTSRVNTARPGYVELVGRPEPFTSNHIKAPLTGQACIWYSYRVERKVSRSSRSADGDSSSRSEWVTVLYESSSDFLLIRDHTGFCIIDMDESPDLCIKERIRGEGKDSPDENSSPEILTGLRMLFWSLIPFIPHYRYTEEVILKSDALYALGQFERLDAKSLPYEPEVQEKLQAYKVRRAKATDDAVDAAGAALRKLNFKGMFDSAMQLHFAQQDPEVMEFDENGDGLLDGGELGDIERRLKNARLGTYRHEKGLQQLCVMRRPEKQPFIVSTESQGRVIRSYGARAALWLSFGGFILGAALTMMVVHLLVKA